MILFEAIAVGALLSGIVGAAIAPAHDLHPAHGLVLGTLLGVIGLGIILMHQGGPHLPATCSAPACHSPATTTVRDMPACPYHALEAMARR